MVRADFPYCYVSSKKLAGGRWHDYWRYRRNGMDHALPGAPGDAAFHARYAELVEQSERRGISAEVAAHSFEWLCKAYLDSAEFTSLADATQSDYRATIETRLIPILGPERYDCITRQHIKRIRDAVSQTHSARTAHKVKQTASILYTWADGEDLLPAGFVNPATGIKRLKVRSKPIEVWSTDEITLFLSACEPFLKTVVLLALYTGQRREDVIKMRWEDYMGTTIRVRQNKTDQPLSIPCHAALRRHLIEIKTKFGGPIARGADGKPMTAGQLSSAMNRAVRKVEGMPHRSMHGLRYAAAAMLEEAGCSVVEISSIIGHRTYAMAIKYARQRKDSQAALRKLEQFS